MLARDPTELTFLDVIEAVEGQIALNVCLLGKNSCKNTNNCSLHDIWVKIQNNFKNELNAINFADICEKIEVQNEKNITS